MTSASFSCLQPTDGTGSCRIGDATKQWLKDLLITAGTVQSFRWKETGEDHYIYSFHGPQSLFIDIMMNIRLLFRAHELGSKRRVVQKSCDARSNDGEVSGAKERLAIDGSAKARLFTKPSSIR